jgi:Tfp pilus assembly protein PilO
MKITPLQQAIILVGLFVLAIIFVYYQFALKPLNTKIAGLQVTLDEKKKDLEEAKKIVAKYAEFKKREDSIQRELEWYQNRIPKTLERTKLLEAVNFLQSRSGVVLTSFTINPAAAAKDTYTEVPVNVRFNSDFNGLIKFLYQISTSSLFMTARDLTVTPFNPAPTDNPNFSLTAQIVVSGIQAKQ